MTIASDSREDGDAGEPLEKRFRQSREVSMSSTGCFHKYPS